MLSLARYKHAIYELGKQIMPHIMSVSDGRLHATTSVYSTWIILANTADQARVSGITVFRMDSFTPGGHSLPTDFTVKCLWIAWGLSSSVNNECVGEP